MTPYVATHGARCTAGLFPGLLFRVATSNPTAYLTFDDGPTSVLTLRLLDLLHTLGSKGTFFLTGAHSAQHPELVRAIAEAGHTIGNHTWSHPDAWRTPNERVIGELDRTRKYLEDVLGRPMQLMRPPFGRVTPGMMRWARRNEQRIVMWDIMPGDFLPSCSTRFIEQFTLSRLRPGSIVVVHDNPKAAQILPPALASIIAARRRQGWKFEAL